MKNILGLDLGTGSLGHSVITYIDEHKPHIHSGVDVFPAAKNKLGQGEKEESNNASRREKRQMRRLYFRKRLRKQHLLALLIQYQMCPLSMEQLDGWRKWDKEMKSFNRKFPSTPEFDEWLAINPYELRVKALKENSLTRFEFGRILYSMIQRRGFLSTRKSSDESSTLFKGKEGIKGISETEEKLENKTLGQYLYEVSAKDNKPFSQKSERIRARYTLRDMYISEFEKIWNAQAKHLGLDKIQVELHRKRIIKGNIDNKKNKSRKAKLEEKFGLVSIVTEISNVDEKEYHYFKYTEYKPFKEHLAGKIWYDEEGNLKYRSNESVLFWQRPLRSQKGLLDRCAFEGNRFYSKEEKRWIVSGPRVIPLSHPLFEIYRAMQQVMQIKMNGQDLPQSVCQDIFIHLLDMGKKKKSIKLSDIKKKFRLAGRFNYDDDFAFSTCPTIGGIQDLVKNSSLPSKDEGKNVTFSIPFNLSLYTKIWHKLYNFDDTSQLSESLLKISGVTFEDNLEELLKGIKLEEGYGNLSHHALTNIVPFMQMGIPLYQSVLLGGIANAVRYANKGKVELPIEVIDYVLNVIPDENRKEGETLQAIIQYMQSDQFPLPVPDERKLRHLLYHPSQPTTEQQIQEYLPEVENLRNPLVEQSLWALRRRVNSLLELYRNKYGNDYKFDEIHIELARDLKMGVKGRQETLWRQRRNNELNNEAREIIRGYGLSPTRDNLHKYKLHKELSDRNNGAAMCPYTGKIISLHDALGQNSNYQIEHIVPRSISNNDSFANKTLCDANINRLKGNRTPWEFFEATHGDKTIWGQEINSWDDLCTRARKLLPDEKYKLFTNQKSSAELSEGFTSSQLVDTAYMSKKAKEYLSAICDKNSIINIPGAVTAELRKLWGLNNILENPINITEQDIEDISIPDGMAQIPVSIIRDKGSEQIDYIHSHYAPIPNREDGDFLALLEKRSGKVYFGRYEFHLPTQFHQHLTNGSYYFLVRTPMVMGFQEKFNRFPITDEDQIIANIEIDSKGNISSTDLPPHLFTKLDKPTDAGKYWLSIPVKDDWVIESSTGKSRQGRNSITCNGIVRNNRLWARPFYTTAYVEQAKKSNVQVTLTPLMEEAIFTKKLIQPPHIYGSEFIISGSVSGSLFTSDEDIQFFAKASGCKETKQYCKLSFEPNNVEWHPFRNSAPEVDTKKQEIIEGKLLIYGDSISFSPEKNRDDHRHHALDAIVIALATRSQYQKLSTYNAHRDDASRGNSERPKFELPWDSLRKDVQQSVASVLVHHKQNNKVVNKVQKRIRKNGRTYNSVGLAVRGKLFDATFSGKRLSPSSGKFAFHKRIKIETITTANKLESVVDTAIKKTMLKRLQNLGVNVQNENYHIPPNAFFENGEYKIFLPNKNGDPVPVKKVRVSNNYNTIRQINKTLNQFVNPENNAYAIIYYTNDENISNIAVPFVDVVKNIHENNEEIITPQDCKKIIQIVRKQDLFIYGLNDDEIKTLITKKRWKTLSDYLYVTTSISLNDYRFKKHDSASKNNFDIRIRSAKEFIKEKGLKKVRMNSTGEIILDD